MSACRPNTQRVDRDATEDRQLADGDNRIGSGDQAHHDEERLTT
jgi:hypothetical protein